MADKKKEPISFFGITLGGGNKKKGALDQTELLRRIQETAQKEAEERIARELITLLKSKSVLESGIKTGETLKANANTAYLNGLSAIHNAPVAESTEPTADVDPTAAAEAEAQAVDRLERALTSATELGNNSIRRAQEKFIHDTQGARSSIIRILDNEETKDMVKFTVPDNATLIKMNIADHELLAEYAGKSLLSVAIGAEDIELIELLSKRLSDRNLDSFDMAHLTAMAVEDAANAMKTLTPDQRAVHLGPLRRLSGSGFDLDTAKQPDGTEAFNILERCYPLDRIDGFVEGIPYEETVLDAMLFDVQRSTQIAQYGGLYSDMVAGHAVKLSKANMPEGPAGEKLKDFLGSLIDVLKDNREKLSPKRAQALQAHHQKLNMQF
ncbi:MAG TPA: hypothetical protein PKW15_04855 [Alphaproteobacteria bacterium]|nr:hypothetical protein [Rhodospirillaceae bacterium]HRJ12553.1 hypothetical protein [Alphaproteobacteria bacterium]